MDEVLQYILNNMEWIFSGIGVAILSVILVWLRGKKQNKAEPSINVEGNVGGSIISGSGHIVTIIEEGISERSVNHAQSNYFNNEGRKKVTTQPPDMDF